MVIAGTHPQCTRVQWGERLLSVRMQIPCTLGIEKKKTQAISEKTQFIEL